MSNGALAAIVVTLLICFGFPIALWVWLHKSAKRDGLSVAKAVLTGALGFFVPQLVIRATLLMLFGEKLYSAMGESMALYGLFLALTAGLFETAGRLLVFKFLLPKQYAWKTGLAAGIGHGGCESMLLIGMTYVNNLMIAMILRSGDASALAPEVRDVMLAVPPTDFLAAGVERLSTICFHVALSVLLLWFLRGGRTWAGFGAVTLLHTAVDYGAIMMQQAGGSVWMIEGALLAVAAVSVWFALSSKRLFGPGAAPTAAHTI